MKICDLSVSLRTIHFVGRSAWHRSPGSSVWKKHDSPAEKSSAEMARALRFYALHHGVLDFNGDRSVCRVSGGLRFPPKQKPSHVYRCAGCGTWVSRRRMAKPGQAVWCGGNRCLKTKVLRFTFGGDLGRAMREVFRELAGGSCACGGSCRDRLVEDEEIPRGVGRCACHHEEVPPTVIREMGSDEIRALLQDGGVRSGIEAAVGTGGEVVVGEGSLEAGGVRVVSRDPVLEAAPARSYIGGGRVPGGSS